MRDGRVNGREKGRAETAERKYGPGQVREQRSEPRGKGDSGLRAR